MSVWTNRTEDNYWCPAQVRLFIDDIWIDDACAVQYSISDMKVPKYGYNDVRFRTVARGQTLVQGRLSINFRYNGYLRSVMMDQIRRRRDLDVLDNQSRLMKLAKNQLTPHILEYEGQAVLEWMSEVAASYDRDKRQSVFEYLQDHWWGSAPSQDPSMEDQAGGALSDSDVVTRDKDALQALQRAGLITGGVNIIMVYGDDPVNVMDPALIKVIQDVHFIGESQIVDIEAPSGGQNIREVYNFFAKDVQPGRVGAQIAVAGGAATA